MKRSLKKQFSHRLTALGRFLRERPILPLFPENALFWAFLILLSIGSAVTLWDNVSGAETPKPAVAGREASMETAGPGALSDEAEKTGSAFPAYYSEEALPEGTLRVYGP